MSITKKHIMFYKLMQQHCKNYSKDIPIRLQREILSNYRLQ